MRRTSVVLGAMMAVLMFAMVGAGAALADTVFSTSSPTTEEDCKNGGYAKYGFKSQGQCIKAVKHATPADTTAPVLTQVAGPAEGELYSGGQIVFESNEPVTFTYDMCAVSSPGTCPNYREYGGGDTRFELNWATWSTQGDTPMVFYLKAVDAAGNVTIVERRWTQEDTTAPDTTVTSGPSMASNNATNKDATFEFVSSEEGGTFECQLVGLDVAFSPCTSPKNYPNLADGAYTFKVRAIDAAGNVDPTPVERKFRVDTAAPVAAITSGPSEGEVVTTDSVSFGWEATDETELYMVNCDLGHQVPGGQQWIAPDSGSNLCGGTSANNPSNPATFSNLEDGQYTFYLLARDRGYNGETIERHFTVDTTPS